MQDFVKTERQERLLQHIHLTTEKFVPYENFDSATAHFPHKNIDALVKSGYTAWPLSKEYGGIELTLYEFLLIQEQIAKADGSTGLGIGWHINVILDLMKKDLYQQDELSFFLEDVKAGALVNRAVSEQATGSPTRGGKPTTLAHKAGDYWIITGQKTFTSLAPALDYFIVVATIKNSEEVAEFLIPKEAEGVSINETWNSIAMRGTGSHDLLLEQVKVPEHYMLKKRVKEKSFSGSMLHIPAAYLGIAGAARDYALKFADEYKPNSLNHSIRETPNVQQLIGEIELKLLEAKFFLYGVAEKWDNGDEVTKKSISPEIGAAKHVVTNNALAIVDKAMRVVGARSLFQDNPLQVYYRDVRAGIHNPPADEIAISLLAKRAFRCLDNHKAGV